ncbi:hypothetical protein A1F97_02372 [Pyrenophora tritici-repentis]|uniref:Uncharacterized protein n=1 Tax=Pyrenophora tritici-repentis TaxID=45151 RepID=A0A2W1HGQ6_9PLEO|nr:hypothetical protein A1F99_071800 [Pyrenophora tritici-repentis]KAF7571519.1 hypothetical protein PtrM4_090190 [Pyrenophora tritici-repentis]KAI1510553.1 hypothetical protein Ptr86124_010358 [Pyrenophora tritici-repentis]KAI1669910.1 hypothetical protein L13192_05426 [Pyrenophora tritici-repentis]KAI1681503.1 hypothetical protein KJE20_08374 [Pyrenophora tritici-repentis]
MSSMHTLSEVSYDLSADLFPDFDGAYIVQENQWRPSDTGAEDGETHSCTASKALDDGGTRGDLLVPTVAEGKAEDEGGTKRACRLHQVVKWLRKMMRCW